MSDADVAQLRRAVSEEREIRVTLDDGHEFRGEAVKETLDRKFAANAASEVRPPHGVLVINVSIEPDALPSDDEGLPQYCLVDIHESEDGGAWDDSSATVTWKTAVTGENPRDVDEMVAEVADVEVVTDE